MSAKHIDRIISNLGILLRGFASGWRRRSGALTFQKSKQEGQLLRTTRYSYERRTINM